MLADLTWEKEFASRLDISRRDSRLLVHLGQSRSLGADSLKDVVHERVHDRHGFGGDSLLGVHLLEDFVDVDAEGLLSGLSVLSGTGGGLGGFGNVLGHLSCF